MSIEIEPFLGFGPSVMVAALLMTGFFRLTHSHATFLAPTALAQQEVFRTNLAVGATVFALGLYAVLTRRDAVKTVIGLCLLENGVHLSLVSLAPEIPETALFGVATEVVVTVCAAALRDRRRAREVRQRRYLRADGAALVALVERVSSASDRGLPGAARRPGRWCSWRDGAGRLGGSGALAPRLVLRWRCSAIRMAWLVAGGGRARRPGANELRVDGLSALLVLVIGVVGFLTSIYSVGYVRRPGLLTRAGTDAERRLPVFYGLLLLFLGTMLWACVTNNIIMLYVAVEATHAHLRPARRLLLGQARAGGRLQVPDAAHRRHHLRALRLRAGLRGRRGDRTARRATRRC